MVNEISNEFTIISDNDEQLQDIYNKYFKNKSIDYCKIKSVNESLIRAWLYSSNIPLIELPQKILQDYNQVWIKNEWNCETGRCGICVGGYKSKTYFPYKVFDYDDLCIEERNMYLNTAKRQKII